MVEKREETANSYSHFLSSFLQKELDVYTDTSMWSKVTDEYDSRDISSAWYYQKTQHTHSHMFLFIIYQVLPPTSTLASNDFLRWRAFYVLACSWKSSLKCFQVLFCLFVLMRRCSRGLSAPLAHHVGLVFKAPKKRSQFKKFYVHLAQVLLGK